MLDPQKIADRLPKLKQAVADLKKAVSANAERAKNKALTGGDGSEEMDRIVALQDLIREIERAIDGLETD